jgi:ketohexokinase
MTVTRFQELESTDVPRSAIGAGDTFIAGMLYGLLCHDEEWDSTLKLRQAVDLATMKVQREGFQGLGARFVRPNETSRTTADTAG